MTNNDTDRFVDDRPDQETLDVGKESLVTQDREGKVEGTDGFRDDRPDRTERGEQAALFADCDDDQATLTGEQASTKCLFDENDTEEP